MVIKRRDFQKAAAFINEFLLKLSEDVDCAELRDTLNLSLLHMQKYYRLLQSRSKEKNAQYTLSLSARGLSPMTPFVDAPDKFRWRWVNLDNARHPSNMSVSNSINMKTLPPMIQAVKAGNLKVMQELIKQDLMRGNDHDGIGRTGLMYAVHHMEHKALNFLLESGADINSTAHDGSTALHCACHEGNEVAVSLLLDYGADTRIKDSYGRAAIHWAVTTPGTECLQLLLDNNIDPTVRDKDGLSPCMWACRMDNIKHFELLCRSNYTVAEYDGIERDVSGRTLMHWAVRRTEPLECLQTLLTTENASYKDDDGRTVLMVAAEIGSLAATRLIVEIAGTATVDDCDLESRTALHLATIGGHGDVVNYLLEHGADINRPDHYNATAWDYARTKQLHYCQLIIMSHQRQRMMSNPTSPLPSGLGLLLKSNSNVQDDFSGMSFRSGSGQSMPITPPHPPKRPRTSRMLQRRANSLTTPREQQASASIRKRHSAGHERKKERIEVTVNTWAAANNVNNNNMAFLSNSRQDSNMTDNVDLMKVMNDVDINNDGDYDIDNISEGGMDVSDIDDTNEHQHNGRGSFICPSPPPPPIAQLDGQPGEQRRGPQPRQKPQAQPRSSKGSGFQPYPLSATGPSYAMVPGQNHLEKDHPSLRIPQPPATTSKSSYIPQAPPRPSLSSSQQASRSTGRGGGGAATVLFTPGGGGATDQQQKSGGAARQHQQRPYPPQTAGSKFMIDHSSSKSIPESGHIMPEQVASPPHSSQSSDQTSTHTQVSVGVGPTAHGGGGWSGGASAIGGGGAAAPDSSMPFSGGAPKSPGVSIEGRKIPPPMLTPLVNAPKPPIHNILMLSEEPIKEKKKKKKKGRVGVGEGVGVGVKSQEIERNRKSPPQGSLEIWPARGYTAPLHAQQNRGERVHSAVSGSKYSKGQPQHSDSRFAEDNMEDPPIISGFAMPIREGTAKSSIRPNHRAATVPAEPESGVAGPDGDGFPYPEYPTVRGVGEIIAEEDELEELGSTGPLIPPPQGFRGTQQEGSRSLLHSLPEEKSTNAKPPLPCNNRSSASRRSSEKDLSPRRRSRPPTSRQ